MKTHSIGFTMGLAFAITSLLVSMLCINIIDICYMVSSKTSKVELETFKVANSMQDAMKNNKEEIIIDSTKILSSIARGEIIEGTKEEIALKQQKAMEEAKLKALEEEKRKKVYDNLTMDELAAKINKMFKKSYLSDKGELFASYSLKNGVDPYTAVAIVLLETGCEWNCSKLVRSCNNVGGMKGGPSCNGTSYKAFNTIDDGIKQFIDNLSENYYKKGLDTPEKMNSKYAASNMWAAKVNRYIDKIKRI